MNAPHAPNGRPATPANGAPDRAAAAPQPRAAPRYIDLFCGIGGFHIAARNLGLQCVFACDIDKDARRAYRHNFGIEPAGDIAALNPADAPDHDLLFAGFPCQPFSIIGKREGMDDPRGTLFFEAMRIIKAKRPAGIVLENVRQLATINGGRALARIVRELQDAGYCVDHRVLNALDFGLPQKRERIIIVAARTPFAAVPWPARPQKMTPLAALLEKDPDPRHFVSPRIRAKRRAAHTAKETPAIWHENKSGNISSHPFSCALRAGASYNYLLVDGERRLTPREMLRLQGFPDSFEIIGNAAQTRKQAGNAVPVPLVQAAIKGLLATLAAGAKRAA